MFTKNTGKPYVRTSENSGNPTGDHLSMRWRNNEVGESPYLLDLAVEVDELEAK